MATFFTHFDAVSFARSLTAEGIAAKARPVPRAVSSSCGTAVQFEGEKLPGPALLADVDRIYIMAGGGYRPVYGEDGE
jgi:hypothetical protein